jgi:hypothetical protein
MIPCILWFIWKWSRHHPSNRATTTVTQNKSRMENVIRLRRLYFMVWSGPGQKRLIKN